MRRVPKALKEAMGLAVDMGWTCDTTKRGHVRLRPPPGGDSPRAAIVFPGTSSEYRGHLNTIADLRRAGVPVPHRGCRG